MAILKYFRSLPRAGLLLLMSLLGACSSPEHDALRFGLQSAPLTLDPRFATDATSARINRLLYQRLVDFDEAGHPVPMLAQWQRVTPDHYRFAISGGPRFHNGQPLTSRDVKATYDFILDPANASPHRSVLSLIASIAAPDARTVDFHLSRPDPLFPGYLVIGIVPAGLIARNHPVSRQPVGSGPFVFVDWPEEGRLLLRRSSDDLRLEFIRVPDPTVRALKLLRGEIDLAQNDLPPEVVGYLAKKPALQVQRREGANFSYLGFNLDDPVTGQLVVRQAVAHALDRPAIIKYALGGGARPATGVLPPDHWAGHPGLAQYGHDPVRARHLLAQAGFTAQRPARIVYKTSSDPFRIRLATIIQRQLAEAGMDVDLRSYDWGTFYGDIKSGRFQMFSLAWVGIKTPDIFRYAFHSASLPPDGANRGRYRSATADGWIAAAETADGADAMARAYRGLQEQVHRDLPYVPLWYEDHVMVARAQVTGYEMHADGNFDGLIKVQVQK